MIIRVLRYAHCELRYEFVITATDELDNSLADKTNIKRVETQKGNAECDIDLVIAMETSSFSMSIL